MTALTLTTHQSQLVTALETPTLSSFDDGVILPGGNPATIEGFRGFNNLSAEQRQTAMNGVKSTLAPLISVISATPAYITVSSFSNGFSNWGDANYGNGTVRYYKDSLGVVHLHGLMRTPASGTVHNIAAFQLPVGFRPAAGDARIFPAAAGDVFCGIQIDDAGQLTLRNAVANNTWISIEVQFYAPA